MFEFLPIGREEQNVVVIRFDEGRTGEGHVGILEVGVAVSSVLAARSVGI